MSLLQIAEPNQSAKPHKHQYALGIDLGTTRSMVAVVRSGKASLIKVSESESKDDSSNQDTLLPSVVYYGNKGSQLSQRHTESSKSTNLTAYTPIVGRQALKFFAQDSMNTIISAKRFMGRSLADIRFSHPYTLQSSDTSPDAMPTFKTDQGDISPVKVSSDILSVLNVRAQKALPYNSIQGAVITVPAYFDEAQRQATKDAATLAGLNVLRLLNEPTAAAVAYGLDKTPYDDVSSTDTNHENSNEKLYLIYDLGGGTFDVSLLKMNKGVFEVLATGGNSALGGDDIDRLIMGWLIKQAGMTASELSPVQRSKIARQAESYKIALSQHNQVPVSLSIDAFSNTDSKPNQSSDAALWEGVLSQDILADIILPITSRTIASCEQVMRDANIEKQQVNDIILVGGSTRMPIIQQIVQQFFGKTPLSHLNPDEVVALGAAQVADQLINKDKSSNVLLLDVTPLSLGLETMGGLVEVLIPRNTPIPVAKRQTFTTYQDGQTGMVIHVVQGERDTVADCRSLGRFELFGIPPMKAGLARIEVTFNIDANGQLTVSAIESTTGLKSNIEITPSYGLSDEQQEQLLRSGFENAEQDKLSRSLLETKLEAQREILALQSALPEFGSLLSTSEIKDLNQAILQLSVAIDKLSKLETLSVLDNETLKSLKTDIEVSQSLLKPLSDEFAARIMDRSVKQSLAGTHTKDWS